MRSGIAMGFVVLSLIAAGAAKMNASTGDESTEGTWKLIGGEADGKEFTPEQLKDGKLVIKGNHYTVNVAGHEEVTGTEKIDGSKDPKQINIKDESGANKGKTCLGIYELKGDEFRVVFAQPGKPRPTTFATAAGSGQWKHIWKRVKE